MVWVLAKEGYKEHVVYQPREWYNPFEEGEQHEPEHQRGDLLIHFPGMEKKHAAMGRWLDKIDQSPEELQIPLSNMTLRADIGHFWTRLDNAKGLLDKAWDLQANDKVKQMFIHNPALGDTLKDATDKMHQIYEEIPFEKDLIRKAHAELSDAIMGTKDAKKAVKDAKKAEVKAKMDKAKDREKNGSGINAHNDEPPLVGKTNADVEGLKGSHS